MTTTSPLGVSMIGCGTVGAGVANLLTQQADLYTRRLGRPILLKSVLVRDEQAKKLALQETHLSPQTITTDPQSFFSTPDVSVLTEVAGGTGIISQFVRRGIELKKHIITANKALLAAEGPQLFALARAQGTTISFEASCGGGIPCLTAMQLGLMANQINAIYGILNGTCNYILTEMTQNDKAYTTALKEAQEKGFAEADPTLDVSGKDAAAKLAIAASLGFGLQIPGDAVPAQGINNLDLADVRFGASFGYDIKLLAIAERTDTGLLLGVRPCFISKKQLLAQVHGSFNAMSIYGHSVGHVMMYGRGAGRMPTASAVVSDLLNIATGVYPAAYQNLHIWPDQQPPAQLLDPSNLTSRFYLRLNSQNAPGTLAKVSTILGQLGISIAAVAQHEALSDQFVPVVILTHACRQGDVNTALNLITQAGVIRDNPVCIRIIDLPNG